MTKTVKKGTIHENHTQTGCTSTGFILLTENTDGQQGRRVYILPELAPKFKAMVDESKESYVLSQLNQLRAIAGNNTAFTNVNDPKEHKTRCGEMDVTYFITQQTTGTDKPGVHITDIDFGLFGLGNMPGAYEVTRRDKDWQVADKTADHIDTQNAAINGLARDLTQAGTRVMPPMVEYAYGRSSQEQASLNAEGFTLFYNPQTITAGGKQWNTPAQKQTNRKTSARKLAALLMDAQNRGQKVQWTIHGNGSDLMHAALEQLSGKNLDKHELMFMAPSDLLPVLSLAEKAKMGLNREVMRYSEAEASKDKASNQVHNAAKVAAAIEQFGPQHHQRANQITAEGTATKSQLAWNLVGGVASFGASTAFQALQAAMAQHALRNGVAVRSQSDNVALNPHLNPHMSKAEFNQHVKNNTGGTVASYKLTFKALLKKIKA